MQINNSILNFKQVLYSNLISTRTRTYQTGANPIRMILALPFLILGLFPMYWLALLIEDEKSIKAFEVMFELLPTLGIVILLMFAGLGIFIGLFFVIYPVYSRIHKIVKTPQQVETLKQKIETLTDNKQEANKVLEMLYKMKQYFNDEQPPDAKIYNLENICEEQKWMIDELKRENKKSVNTNKEDNIKILQLENKLQNANTRLDKIEKENREKLEAISDKIYSKNNSENTKGIDKSNRDEIID